MTKSRHRGSGTISNKRGQAQAVPRWPVAEYCATVIATGVKFGKSIERDLEKYE
jgi:hypothetical protein